MTHHSGPDDQAPPQEPGMSPSFWRSRAGIYLIVGVAIGGLLLGYEHRIHVLGSNWLLLLLLLICVGMHFFMHGGHGSGSDKT